MGPEDLIRLGRYWAAKLKYYPNSDVPRDFANQIAQEINDELDDGVSIRPGWRAYDPVISMNGRKPSSYEQLSDFFSQQEDGGAESANRILGWMNNELQFEDLLPQEQDFAAITHLAETGRGYNPPSTNLENFLTEITESESGEDAANVWLDINKYYPPSLTYSQDLWGPEYEPDSDSEDDSIDDSINDNESMDDSMSDNESIVSDIEEFGEAAEDVAEIALL